MKRKIAPAGSKLSLPDLFSGIQDDVELNRLDLMRNLFSDYGVLYSGSEDTSLKISDYDGTTIEISPGFGICEAGHFIQVKAEDSAGSKRLGISDGFDNSVYIQHEHVRDTPTDILDGFVWTGSGGTTANTNQYDFFSLTITDPGTSGIELANVARSGASIVVTDLRDTNRLVAHDSLLSDDVQTKLHYQNTDTGTDSETFRVGVGSLNEGAGYPVQIGRDFSSAPVDVRVGHFLYYIPSANNDYSNEIPFFVYAGIPEPFIKVRFNWGHTVSGTGNIGVPGNNTEFTITAVSSTTGVEFQSFGVNELAGQYMVTQSDNYLILSNLATSGGDTVLTLDTEDTIDDTSSNKYRIHSNADDYVWEIIPVDPDTDVEQENDREQGVIATLDSGIVRQYVETKLNIGWKYKFKVMARQNGYPSSVKDLEAGSFILGGITYNYPSPFYALIDTTGFDMVGMAVTGTGTDYGFSLSITKPTNETPTDYEICYNILANGEADFSNSDHAHIVTSETTVKISTDTSTNYNVKVRPMLGGQVVNSTPAYVETDVLSGGGGFLPNDKILPAIYVDIKSETTDLLVPDSVVKETGLRGYTLEYGSSHTFLYNYYVGKPAYDINHSEYYITWHDKNTMQLVDDMEYLTDATTILESGIYVGNTIVKSLIDDEPANTTARSIFTYTFPQDARITAVDFDCTQTTGTGPVPAHIRFYQKNFVENAKTIDISSVGFATYAVDLDILSALEANRTMIIDAWDPTDVSNSVDVKGTLTVKYRDKVQETIMLR